MSAFRGCGAIATMVSLCFPQAMTVSRRQNRTKARTSKGIEVSPGMFVRASYPTARTEECQACRRVSQPLSQRRGVARQLDVPQAHDRPAPPPARHGYAALPVGDLRAAVRQEFLVGDRRNELDDQVGGRDGETPTRRIAPTALGRLPVIKVGDSNLVACQGHG